LALPSSRENLEYSLLLLDSAFYISFLINDNQRIGDTYLSKGLIYLPLNADSSKRYLDKAAEYFILINDKRRLANYYSLLGDWSQKQKLNTQTIINYNKASKLYKLIGNTIGEISIYNAVGQLVLRKEFSNNTPLAISELSKGCYVVEISYKTYKVNKRLLVK
jgi:hypothetical protein